jgi:Ca-activated chloride channel family protein
MRIKLPLACAALFAAAITTGINLREHSPTAQAASQCKEVELRLDRALAVGLPSLPSHPSLTGQAKAVPFKTPKLEGWIVKFGGSRPIATPAYADGMIFVGGGYGSHEFFALDALTGRQVWKVNTSDDGPTAAVVEGGFVAFNTESCTVYVVEERTGKIAWQEWLGDPLMSQPAIAKGRLYMAYPGGQRGHGQSGHKLLCADLKTGKHLWEQPITADVITAPVIEGEQVFLSCFDGTSFCLNAFTGKVIWKKTSSATSAPTISNGQMIVTRKQQKDTVDFEGIEIADCRPGIANQPKMVALAPAPYFKAGAGTLLPTASQVNLDAAVGFAGGAPPAAGMSEAAGNVGVSTVAGGWAYQGSRAQIHEGQIINAQGDLLNCYSASSGKVAWQARAKGSKMKAESQVFAPPALGKQNLYLLSADGHVVSINQKTGNVNFMYSLNQPMAFQPALALGNIYIGTNNGMLICLKTGDTDADGWTAWGGNAQHNKK